MSSRHDPGQVRVESVRFDGAKAALESGYTITEAAERVCYGSSETSRRAFVTRLGVSPSAYQQRFWSTQRRDGIVNLAELVAAAMIDWLLRDREGAEVGGGWCAVICGIPLPCGDHQPATACGCITASR
jgi:hypothetical protein